MYVQDLVFFCLLWPAQVLAAQSDMPNLFSEGLKVFGGLGLVIGILFLFYTLSRKGKWFFPASNKGEIKLIETRHLGPKNMLCLIEVRGQRFLVGVGQERIELISAIDSPKDQSSFEESLRESEKR